MNSRRPPRRSRRGPLIRAAATAGALALGALSLAGCGSGSTSSAQNGTVNVIASFYPMEFLAQEIGGEHVTVTGLTEPGVDPHHLELTPRQVGELGQADLVVYLEGLQPAVDEAIAQADVEHVAEASSYTTLEDHGDGGHEEGHAHEGPDHGGHDHGGHDHGGHDHGGHAREDHGGHAGHDHATQGDPHIWLDPVRYAQVAKGVGKQLAKVDPAHEKAYEKNTEALVDRLKTLDQDFREGLKGKKTDTFITTHAAFGYLAERYGLHEEAIAGTDPESGSISGAHMKELHKIAKEEDVTTVFHASNANDDTARTLARDLGLRTDVLSPLESLEDPKTQDYFSVMRQNLQALRTALGAK